jgi:superfamily II DNA or RNA helicase
MFPSLFFCVDKKHSFDLSECLRSNGIRVYPLTEDTPPDQRKRFVRLFKEGEIDGLASCGVIDEGFDAPNAVGGFHCAPTKSGLRYRQRAGRILRPYPAPQGERLYQKAALHGIWNHLKQGVINQLVVMPTGTGKTRMAAQVPKVIKHWREKAGKARRGRLLFLVHREELALQTADTFREHTDMTVGVEKAGSYAGDADVVVGSVQTLGPAKYEDLGGGEGRWEYNSRLASLRPEDFDCIITDEAHHFKGKFYNQILRRMHALKGEPDRDPDILSLFITATPNRADNVGMEAVCDALVYEYGIVQATKDGYLAPLHAFRCETTVDLSELKTRMGDLEPEKLSKLVNIPERNMLVAREYLRIRDMIAPDFASNVGPVKPYCVLVDFVDATGRHSLISAPQLYGLREKFDPKGANVLEQAAEIDSIQAANPGLDLREATDLEDAKRRADAYKTSLQKLDLLNPSIPNALRHLSKMTWVAEAAGSYRLGLMDGSMLTVREDALGGFEVNRHVRGVKTKLYAAKDLPQAISLAEKEIPPSDKRVLAADAGWRTEPPTDKQCSRLIVIDRHYNHQFHGNMKALYTYVLARYTAGDPLFSRGGIADRMNRIDAKRR